RTREHAARLAGVSPRLIQHAITVRKHDAALFEDAKRGQVALPRAVQQIQRRQRDMAIGMAPQLPDGIFDLIYGDPPWRSESPSSGWSPEQHYPTQSTAQIKELAVPAADVAVLFLWAVV